MVSINSWHEFEKPIVNFCLFSFRRSFFRCSFHNLYFLIICCCFYSLSFFFLTECHCSYESSHINTAMVSTILGTHGNPKAIHMDNIPKYWICWWTGSSSSKYCLEIKDSQTQTHIWAMSTACISSNSHFKKRIRTNKNNIKTCISALYVIRMNWRERET